MNTEKVAELIEQIAFLKTLNAQLLQEWTIHPDLAMSLLLLTSTVAFFGAAIVAIFGTNLSTIKRLCFLSISIFSAILAFRPADNNQLEQLVNIYSVIKELPPSTINNQWFGAPTLGNEYITAFTATSLNALIALEIKVHLKEKENALARIEFISKGGLDKLKKELLEKALLAKQNGTANAGQLALIEQEIPSVRTN